MNWRDELEFLAVQPSSLGARGMVLQTDMWFGGRGNFNDEKKGFSFKCRNLDGSGPSKRKSPLDELHAHRVWCSSFFLRASAKAMSMDKLRRDMNETTWGGKKQRVKNLGEEVVTQEGEEERSPIQKFSGPAASPPQIMFTRRVHACGVTSVTPDSLRPHGLSPARLLCPWDSPGKNTGVGCHALVQGIFQIQGSNPHLMPSAWAG